MKKYNSAEEADQPFFKGGGMRVYQMLVSLKPGETYLLKRVTGKENVRPTMYRIVWQKRQAGNWKAVELWMEEAGR
jgi:hypothetical protein